jgi:DNA-binding protein HU-beta
MTGMPRIRAPRPTDADDRFAAAPNQGSALDLRPYDSWASTDPGGRSSPESEASPVVRLVGRSAYRAVRGPALNVPFRSSDSWRSAVALTQSQFVSAVAERAELSKADAKRALAALDEIVLEELGNAQKVRIGGLVQLSVRVKPAQKARKGRNPATGEEITIAAKPASVDLRARPLARAKGALPSVQKARRRLAA